MCKKCHLSWKYMTQSHNRGTFVKKEVIEWSRTIQKNAKKIQLIRAKCIFKHCILEVTEKENKKVSHLLMETSCGEGDTRGCPAEFGRTWRSRRRSAFPVCSLASSYLPHRPPYSYTHLWIQREKEESLSTKNNTYSVKVKKKYLIIFDISFHFLDICWLDTY